MKVVAFIPIKLNSERLHGKNVKPFHDGTPLMHLIQRTCLATKRISETYVYCSDEAVTDYLIDGVKFLKRPRWLDDNSTAGNFIIAEFIKTIKADIYLQTHATAPFATSESFDMCIEKVASNEYDSAFCATKLQSFLWQDKKPLNFDPGSFPRTQDLPMIYKEVSNAYVFAKSTFEKYNARAGANPYIHIISDLEATDVDYQEDFDLANLIYKEIIKSNAKSPAS